jgi:NAD(P)-dependent dehydrogenase (short-subunit alcohol dehydrogenase family)
VVDENATVNEFTGRTIVVTGANSGIGLAAATGFARGGGRVALVGRDRPRLEEALSAVRAEAGEPSLVTAFQSDFTSLDNVRALASELREAYPHIDVLANNAGGAFAGSDPTVDGFERTIQVNHLAPFLLTHLLLDRLQGSRVIATASDAHAGGQLDPLRLNPAKGTRMMTTYGTSKQANILFAAEAARRWPAIESYSFHPGVVKTRFGRDSGFMSVFFKINPLLLTPEQGADTLLWLASAPSAELTNGGYYAKRKLRDPSAPTRSPETAATLWETSTTAVGL